MLNDTLHIIHYDFFKQCIDYNDTNVYSSMVELWTHAINFNQNLIVVYHTEAEKNEFENWFKENFEKQNQDFLKHQVTYQQFDLSKPTDLSETPLADVINGLKEFVKKHKLKEPALENNEALETLIQELSSELFLRPENFVPQIVKTIFKNFCTKDILMDDSQIKELRTILDNYLTTINQTYQRNIENLKPLFETLRKRQDICHVHYYDTNCNRNTSFQSAFDNFHQAEARRIQCFGHFDPEELILNPAIVKDQVKKNKKREPINLLSQLPMVSLFNLINAIQILTKNKQQGTADFLINEIFKKICFKIKYLPLDTHPEARKYRNYLLDVKKLSDAFLTLVNNVLDSNSPKTKEQLQQYLDAFENEVKELESFKTVRWKNVIKTAATLLGCIFFGAIIAGALSTYLALPFVVMLGSTIMAGFIFGSAGAIYSKSEFFPSHQITSDTIKEAEAKIIKEAQALQTSGNQVSP